MLRSVGKAPLPHLDNYQRPTGHPSLNCNKFDQSKTCGAAI